MVENGIEVDDGSYGAESSFLPAKTDEKAGQVSLMVPMEMEEGDYTAKEDDDRVGRFINQFTTLFKRSFKCVARDMVGACNRNSFARRL